MGDDLLAPLPEITLEDSERERLALFFREYAESIERRNQRAAAAAAECPPLLFGPGDDDLLEKPSSPRRKSRGNYGPVRIPRALT